MLEPNDSIISDKDESDEETESLRHEEAVSEDFPHSLLSYFEASKNRASVCEKLILQDFEDFPVCRHNEGFINSSFEPDKDIKTQNKTMETPCETNSDVDSLMQSDVSVKTSDYESKGEKHHCEEVQKTEQRLQREADFQEELKKIREVEKFHQFEVQLMKRRAQEKMEQEMLLQQEFFGNLKKQVEQERRRLDEERKRRKAEEERKIKKMEEKRMREEEIKRKQEEERKIIQEEEKRKREEESKKKREDERKRVEEEAKRKRDEEINTKREDKRKRVEEEKSKRQEENNKKTEERKRVEEEEKKKREEESKKKEDEEEERKRVEEEEKRRGEEENKRKQVEERKRMKEEEKKKREAESKKKKEEERKRDEEEEKRKEESKKEREDEKKRVEEKRKREEEMEKKRGEERKRVVDKGIKKREEKNKIIIEDERKVMEEEEKRWKEEEDKMKREDSKKIEEEEKFVEMRFKEVGDEEKREEQNKKKGDDRIHEVKTNRGNKDMINEEVEGKVNGSLFRGEEMMRLEEEGWKQEAEVQRDRLKNRNKEEDEETKKEKIRHERMKQNEKEEQKKKEWTESKRKDGTSKKDLLLFEEGEEMKKRDEVRIQSLKMIHLERNEEVRKTNNQVEEQKAERMRLKEEKEYGKTEEETRIKEVMTECKGQEGQMGEMNHERTKEDEEKEDDKWKTGTEEADVKLSIGKVRGCEDRMNNGEERLIEETEDRERKQDPNEEVMITKMEEKEGNITDENWDSSRSGSSLDKSASSLTISDIKSEQKICPTSADETKEQHPEVRPRPSSCSSPAFLPEHTEQKRLSWMRDGVSWSQLALQNRRKQKGSVRGRRGPRGAAEPSSLPPLCPHTLLQSSGWKSLQEITSLTLEDRSSCSLSTLVQCPQLCSLTLRRCGVRSLEGISQLKELCYIDLRENEVSSVDCENMTSLRVLLLAHNKLTSIHGLGGAENLDVLDLSYNSITRIAGLESVKRLQKLSVNHNQLISTKGLKDVCTLLYLDCSHNHLACVECLDSSALLHTLDLRANSLSEAPSLNNQVLLRTLRLDDNNISCLQGLADCWLPLLQHLSATQNRITQLPSMADFVSLENLDLRFNCLSELQNVCENLEGCHFLQEVLLSGNPVQQESGWRSALQRAVPGLKVIDDQQSDSCPSPVSAQQLSVNLDRFLMFCQAQLQQTQGLQQHLSRELRNVSSPLDALKANCWFFTKALRLAEDQRFAHEYGDTSVADQHLATHKTPPEETLGLDCGSSEKLPDYPKSEPANKSVILNRDDIRDTSQSSEDSPAEETHQDTLDSVTADTRTESTVAQKGERNSFSPDKEPLSTYHYLDRKNRAAVVTQQRWRKSSQKCGNVNVSSITDKGGDDGGDEGKMAGPSSIRRNTISQEDAATVIQAFCRGFVLRRRLASALAAVTCSDDEEDDTLEEVDLEKFVFDESALEKYWTLTLPDDSPPPSSASEQSLTVKPTVTSDGHSQDPPVWIPKQAWMAEQEESEPQTAAAGNTNRSQPPDSASAHCGLSQQVKEIMEEWGFTDSHTALLLLKRAQKMKPAKQKQNKHSNPSVHAALLRNSNHQLGSAEARSRLAQHNRYCLKVGDVKLGFHQGEQVEETQDDQRLQTQAHQPDSEPFLPEINSSVLSGGRVQLVATSSYVAAPSATGLCVDTCLITRPLRGKTYPHRNTLDHYSKAVSSSKRVSSASSAKERISFRDGPVQLSGGWGGGKKRDRSKTFSHK